MNYPPIKRIFLVSANKLTNPYPVFPLGVAFMEAALREAGYEVRIWDQLIHSEEDLEEGLGWGQAIGLSLRNVDNVSSTDPIAYVDEFSSLIGQIRAKTDVPIIAGGSAFSIFPAELFDELQLDWGIQGEAEKAIIHWLEAINGNLPLAEVPGLVYREQSGSVRVNPTTSLSPEEIPSPKPDKDWIQAYNKLGGMMNAQTQRGCALRCTYCTYPWIEGRCYRHRKVEDLVDELRHIEGCGTRYVFLTDSVFNTSNKHVEAFCTALIREKLKLEWGCFARPRHLDGDLLDLMIEAGLKHIEFGSDSFCDTTLISYGKSFRLRDILESSETASKRRVHTCHYVIFGGPGETESTIRETIANSKLLPSAPIFAFSGMRIYPHTPLYKTDGSRQSARDLIRPYYYSPEGISNEKMAKVIREETRDNPNWFLSDHADNNEAFMRKFRQKGKQGPLWEYLALSRRLNQVSAPPTHYPDA
jgi:radical SAM superfamily enzyme YgiQ (UPF0313 family)